MRLPTDIRFKDISLAFCHLDDDRNISVSDASSSLSASERARAARFHFPRDAKRYMRGRGFLRRELGRVLDIAPDEVALTTGLHDKPELAGAGPGFNLSHSGHLAVLAIRDAGPVGLDVELADRTVDPLALANTCFVPHETKALAALSDDALRRSRFFAFWTAKEALMKLTGLGMSLAPKSIELQLCDGLPTGFQSPSAYRSVTLHRPEVWPACHIALAWETF